LKKTHFNYDGKIFHFYFKLILIKLLLNVYIQNKNFYISKFIFIFNFSNIIIIKKYFNFINDLIKNKKFWYSNLNLSLFKYLKLKMNDRLIEL